MKISTAELDAKLKRFSKRAENLPWDFAGRLVKKSIEKNFDVGGRYSSKNSKIGGSKKWVRRKKTVAWPILKKSLKLKNSIYWQPIQDGVQVGSRGLKYNRAQNLGYDGNNLPARPFVVIQPLDINKISARFKSHIIVN